MYKRHQQGSIPDVRQLDFNFKKAVLLLLKEEYQVLGFKAAKDTIGRLIESSESLKGGGKEIAGHMLQFYQSLVQDEGYFKGVKKLSDKSSSPAPKEDLHDDPKPSMERIGGAAIIAFYSRLIQTVMRELEAEIGSKADKIFSNIIQKSEYYDKFL